jgi:hypothetical protein
VREAAKPPEARCGVCRERESSHAQPNSKKQKVSVFSIIQTHLILSLKATADLNNINLNNINMNPLQSFMSGLLEEESLSSFEILSDNARVSFCNTNSQEFSLCAGETSDDDDSSRNCLPLHPEEPKLLLSFKQQKRRSRWDASSFTGQKQLTTPKRRTSPMRMPLRSLATHLDFGGRRMDRDKPSRPAYSSTLDLMEEAISVCAEMATPLSTK